MKSLGQRIREERRKQNLTLQQISNSTKLSMSFLSQIERDLAQPSVSTLKKIAHQFGISVVNLFMDENPNHNNLGHPPSKEEKSNNRPAFITDVKVVRANRRKSLALPGAKVLYNLITPDLNRQIEILFLKLSPGEHSGDEPMIDPPGEKCCLVLKGTLEFRVGEEVSQLQDGDSIYFPANIPHSWRGKGKETIEVILVLTPPSF
jgi:transcriptional regulator with XRE-family HTH domain